MLKNEKLKKILDKIKAYFVNNYKNFMSRGAYNRHWCYAYAAVSFFVTIIIEMLARHSFIDGIYYLVASPYVVFCNALIVLLTLSVTLFTRRRIFFMSIISIIWIIFGIANSVMLSFRVTPFSAGDLRVLDSVWPILNKYVSVPMLILMAIGAVVAVVALFFIWRKIPVIDHKIDYLKNGIVFVIIFFAVNNSILIGINAGVMATRFGNLANAYMDYGFVYCFANSVVNTGIDKPDTYSDENIKKIQSEETKKTEKKDIKKTPNIIFLQLESFYDVNNMKNLTFSENPLPTFTKLKEEYPSGYLNVPVVGAGTVNTELEVMTGMNMDDFGPGEYPFKTILKDTTCESICYNLKNYGYKCHAIHDNTATFYSRNIVFSNLGYDTFTTKEMMIAPDKTEMGWVKDKYLTNYIMQALKSTKKTQDFIYTISVQGHGSYPVHTDVDYPIKVNGIDDDSRKAQFEYYVQQINEMDTFISDLITELDNYGEDTVLVMYGDHLPSLGISEDELINGDVYQTEYIIWSNFDTDYTEETIEAYQMESKILEEFDMNAGDINNYTQEHRYDEDQDAYLDGLKNLEYDMLYGDNILYDGENPYVATDLQFGLKKVRFTSISPLFDDEGTIYIYGRNFTNYSKVYINGERYDPEFVDQSTLVIKYPDLEIGDEFLVKQQNSNKHVLVETDPIVYEDENVEDGSDEETTTEAVTKAQKKKNSKKNSKKNTKKNSNENSTDNSKTE